MASTFSETESCAPAQADRKPRWLVPSVVVLAVVGLGVIVYIFRAEATSIFTPPAPRGAPHVDEPVTITGPGLISVAPGVPLERRLHLDAVEQEDLNYPLLNVTGYVMARLAPGEGQAESRWDFANPEVATTYADWLNARAELIFLEQQAKKTRELVTVQVDFLKSEMKRKEQGVAMGAVPPRDLISAKADFMKADLQGKKDINEVETALKKAVRNRGLLERQLFQAGVDPEVVRKTTKGLVLVVADVPEAKMGMVQVGQPCDARFFGLPHKVFKEGIVGRLGPSVSKEKRTLRVTFELKSDGQLLPGMFAEIGLGTASRKVLTVPTEAVLHAGNFDYVMKEESPGKLRVIKIKVDEPRLVTQAPGGATTVPVLDCADLHRGDRVVGAGAILLKPMMVKALAYGASGTH